MADDAAKGLEDRARDSKPTSGFLPKRRFWLHFGGHAVPLREGTSTLGRSANCHFRINSALASREHAKLTFDGGRLSVTDLDSRNGTFLDDRAVTGTQVIEGPCVLRIADRDVQILLKTDDSRTRPTEARMAAVTAEHQVDADELEPEDATKTATGFELLGSVVDKSLAMGRADQAEHVIAGHLAVLLEEAERGVAQKSATLASAARTAVKLALGTHKGAWVDYCFKLYAGVRAVMPPELVDDLHRAVRRARPVNRKLLRQYVDVLRQRELGPTDRFVVQRLEGLDQLLGHL